MGDTPEGKPTKKIFENPIIASIAVPVSIVLLGSGIIWFLSKALNPENSYKSLVSELKSKTFGNRWVAAFELSKVLARKQVPVEDHDWLIENLSQVFKNTADVRTQNFIVLAISSLKSAKSAMFLSEAVGNPDKNISFNAVVAISHLPPNSFSNWSALVARLEGDDPGLQQAVMLCLAHHKAPGADKNIEKFLKDPNASLRFAAATSLIPFKNDKAIDVLKEILLLSEEQNKGTNMGFNQPQVSVLKLRVMDALIKNKWNVMNSFVAEKVLGGPNVKVNTKAQELLNTLKN